MCPIGLDLGTYSVKLLQLERRETGWRALAARTGNLTPDLPHDPATRCDALKPVIEELIHSGPFKGRRVVSCLPATDVQYKSMRLPKMPPDELGSALEWEASDRLKFDRAHFRTQFCDAGEVRQGEEPRQEVIVLAARNQVIHEHVHLLTSCGLHPVAIDATPSALTRFALNHFGDDREGLPRGLLDIGYSSSKMLICHRGRVVFFKLIDIGGRKFDQAVAEHLEMPLHDAAELRRRHRNGSSNDQASALFGATRRENIERAVFDAWRGVAGELAREVALCLRYHSVTFRGGGPQTIGLVGGESYEPHLIEIIANGVGVGVETIEPMRNIDLATTDTLAGADKALSEWTLALGLSMRSETAVGERRAA